MADPLAEALRSIRLTGGLFVNARFTAPWSVVTAVSPEEWAPFLARPAQLVAYHVVVSGELVVAVGDAPPIRATAGEIVLLPRNEIHKLASGADVPPVCAKTLIPLSTEGGLERIEHGGGGAETRLVCGFLGSEQSHSPLFDALPSILTLDIGNATSRDWIESSVRFAAEELMQGRLATSGVVSRLSELLLIEAIRHYAAQLPDRAAGWLKGLSDPQIGRALTLIHREPARPWSTDELARAAAMSRSAFMERFTTLVGLPPIRYLTMCRLEAAQHELRGSVRSVAELAHRVGYDSEEAFSRAFKREFGLSPLHWRAQLAAG
jgi:AraC-like DNA-binding protein